MPFFSKVFRRDGGASKAKKNADQGKGGAVEPPKPRWEDAWSRREVAPEEIQELIHECTIEMKSRGTISIPSASNKGKANNITTTALDMPFLLLPFRPGVDASSSRIFIGKFFKAKYAGANQFNGHGLQQELRLTEPMVLCSIMKWCWSRLPGGVVTWDVYEMFKMGEQDAQLARHSFDTFIPLSVESSSRKDIIFDFFDLLAAIAARGKTNGLGGRKLSRMAGWWAFEHSDQGNGFDGGYKSWQSAADAASHLFFAYLRSLSPDPVAGAQGISKIPRSLQSLLSQTEYPPETPLLMFTTTPKVVMIVDAVSPTPFALLRRAKHFEYRDDDMALQEYSLYEDPVKALTDECRRVLNAISRTNQSNILDSGSAKNVQDPSWSRFEDLGFAGISENDPPRDAYTGTQSMDGPSFGQMRSHGQSRNTDFGRPTTPSWADFLSTGFADDRGTSTSSPVLLPPDKVLPPIGEGRGHSSQSHVRNLNMDTNLEPGELASITKFDLDDTFWWVWMTSLASEEPAERKAVFGRCALIETNISGGRWLVMEEQVKGASPGPEEGAYIAEKKSRFSFRRRGLTRRKSTGKKAQQPPKDPHNRSAAGTPYSRITIGADQQAKIQAAAARLINQQMPKEDLRAPNRTGQLADSKTNSMLTLQPQIVSEAAPAMKWAKEFDKGAIRARYLGNMNAGKGQSMEFLGAGQSDANLTTGNGSVTPTMPKSVSNRDLPALPQDDSGIETPKVQVPRKSVPPPPAPLPPSTPPEKAQSPVVPVPVADEKPAPADHPALRNGSISQQPTSIDEAREEIPKQSTSSPESARAGKTSPKKLKKQVGGGGGGLKKLFLKKNNRVSRAISPQPPKEPFRSDTPEQFEPAPAPDAHIEPILPKAESPRPPPAPEVDDRTETDISRVPSHDEREAAREFNRFDQGPMDDVPAFMPTDSPNPSDGAPAPPEFGSHSRSSLKPTPTPTPPPVRAESPAAPAMEVEPEPATEDNLSPMSAQSQADRWAQIRKNAAERAQRYSEEQTGPGTGTVSGARSHSQSYSKTTDDGDTSGEETIESRVARIKARVAELTGNIEQGGSPRR
ncbi:hypothetical protein NA57DRAFT_55556 [Rhizodiscina lignyota]|uniref:Meiotically up-regulated protein Msb1/Mug8 domain-containing protein n=1 Tax=Rhizodiscina lignyota TaxID=1504668 RepID=A0A9P4IJF0_9PEZI|nr:hypothetical protein NA57DRAFT_55556 [Rhizodiscina lignyota]